MATRKKQAKKNKTVRKAPAVSATSLPEGTIQDGFVIKKAANGVPRWMPVTSAQLNGFRRFTVDVAAKFIGKPILLYCREFKDTWPKKKAWNTDATYTVLKFVPNGDAIQEKTTLAGWLRKREPTIRPGSHFYLDGPLSTKTAAGGWEHFVDGMQVDSLGGKIVSDNLLTTEVFVTS